MAKFSPRSAPPILALDLFDLEHLRLQGLNTQHGAEEHGIIPEPRLATACNGIDDVLDGGFSYGLINSLAADSVDASNERTLVAMHAVVTHLLAHSEAQAAWIDTEGKFSPTLLKDVIVLRLSKQGTHTTAESILDRVQIMRILDIHGLVEVVNELRQAYMDKDLERTQLRCGVSSDREDDKEYLKITKGEKEQGEDRDSYDFGSIGVVVVDTIYQLLSETMASGTGELLDQDAWAFENEKPESVGLFVAVSRSLSTFAKERNICILFLNSTYRVPDDGDPWFRWTEVLPSAFIATEQIPALGPVYAECVDLNSMISKYPYGSENTSHTGSLNYNRATVEPNTMTRGVESARFRGSLIEVLGDRNGPRGGMFGCFDIDGAELVGFVIPDDGSDEMLL